MSDLQLNIRVTFDDSGLKKMRSSVESIKKVMKDLNKSMPKMSANSNRTAYGQLAADIRSLGNASEKAAPKIDRFVVSLNKFNTNLVTRSLRTLNQTSGETVRATGNIINAQTRLRESLDRSTTAYRAANTAAKNYAKAENEAARAQAALQRARTAQEELRFKQATYLPDRADRLAAQAAKERMHAENLAFKQQQQQWREQQAAMRQMERANEAVARQAAERAQRIKAAFQSIIRVVRELAQAIRSTLTSAVRSAGTALSAFGTSAAARFASLRTQLDATAKAFLRLGTNSRSAGNAFAQMWSGDALIRTGRNLMQFVHQGQMLLRQTYTQFAETERSVSRAAVAGIDPIWEYRDAQGNIVGEEDYRRDRTGTVSRHRVGWSSIPMDATWDFIYSLQRGEFGGTTPIRSLTTQELADATYFLTSAIGEGVGRGVGDLQSENIARMLGPMAIFASATQTPPEDYIKGVLSIGQQFGFNPRDFQDDRTGQTFAGISGMVALLANMSSMEPADVVSAMRMVGPSSFLAFGGQEAMKWDSNVREKALFDTFIAMFAASEMGLRGSQAGRAYQRMFSGLSDATPKTRRVLAEAFGFDSSEEGYRDWLYNERGVMDFGGHGEGILGLVSLIQEYQGRADTTPGDVQRLLSELFTENATRGMAATLAGMDSDGVQQLIDVVREAQRTGDWSAANELLTQVMQQEGVLISNAVTNLQNAWGQFANTIFRTSQGMIIGSLDAVANVFRELSDIITAFPKIGQTITGAFSSLMVGGGVIAGLLMIAGTLVSLNRAFSLIGISAGIVTKALVTALPFALMKVVPMLAIAGAAIVAFRAAWESNFLGIRETVTGISETLGRSNFSDTFIEFLGTDRFHSIYSVVMRLKWAFEELVSGIFFNVGNTDNLGSLLYDVFGRNTGAFLYENAIRLRLALRDLRTEVAGFFSELSSGVSNNLPDFLRLFSGFLDIVLTGTHGRRGQRATEAIGELLGIEDFDDRFQAFAYDQRDNLFTLIQLFMQFGSTVGSVLTDIGRNVSQIFTFSNIVQGMQAILSFVQGFAAGIAAAFLGALKAVEAVTRAIANLGGAGRYVSGLVRDLTGLQMTLEGVASVIGAAVGLFVGSRFMAPLLLFNTTLQRIAVVALGVTVTLGGMIAQVLGAVAGFGALGAVIGVAGAALTLVLGTMFAYTAATQGMDAAIEGLSSAWTSFRDVMAETISNIVEFGRDVALTALEISGVSSSLLTFESVGRAIGQVVSVIAYAAAGAVSAVVLFGSALFRIGREHGPALLEVLRGAAPALGAIALVATGVVAAIGQIGYAVYQLVTAFLDAENVLISFGAIALGVWVAFNLPIAALIASIASIGFAILSASGNFETFADSFDSMLDSLPVGMQKAVDGLVLTFLGGVDKMLAGWESFVNWVWGPLGIGDKYSAPENTLTYQYKVSRGMITPATHTEGELLSHTFHTSPQRLQDTIADLEMQVQPIAERYFSQGYSADESLRMARREVFTSPENLFSIQSQVSGIHAQGLNRLSSITGGIYWGVSDTGQLIPIGHGQLTHDIYKDTGTGSSQGEVLTQTDAASYWDLFGQGQGAPAGAIKSQEDFTKWFSNERGLHSVPIGDDILQYLPEEVAQQIEGIKSWSKYQDEINRLVGAGYSSQEAADMVDFQYLRAGMELPEPPDTSDWNDGLDEMDELAERMREVAKNLYDAMLSLTDPFSTTARHFDFNMLRGQLGGSGASFLTSVFDPVSSAVGESEWWNQYEYMADAAGLGLLDVDMYGVDAHEVMRPLFERIERETGVAYSDLVADIPRWFAPEPIIAIAGQEIFSALNTLDQSIYDALDPIIHWEDFVTYAASQAAAGRDWDLSTYLAESLGWSQEDIDAAFEQWEFNPDILSSKIMEGSEMLALSMEKGIDVIDAATLETVTALTDMFGDQNNMLHLTMEQFETLTQEELRVLELQGWTVVVHPPEIEFDVQETSKRVTDAVNQGIRGWLDAQDHGFSGNKTWGDTGVPVVTDFPTAGAGTGMIDDQPAYVATAPKTVRTKRTVNVEVEEEVGEVTVSPLDFDAIDSALDNAIGSGLSALMDTTRTTRTARTRTEEITVSVDVQVEQTAIEQVQIDLSELLGAMEHTITVGLDPSEATAALAATEEHIRGVVEAPYIVTIDGDSIPAQEAVAAVASALHNLVSSDYSVTIYAVNYASSALTTIEEQLNRLNGKVANVGVNIGITGSLGILGSLGFHAEGGVVSGTNYQIVGEDGPELLKLPWGTRVYPHEETMRMLQKLNSTEVRSSRFEVSDRRVDLPVIEVRGSSGSSGEDRPPVQINFGDVTINDDKDIEELAERIDEELAKRWGMVGRGQVSVDYRSYQD